MRRRELPGGIPPPTKTEYKRQAQAVQDFADRLIAAPVELVARLDLPDKLADAIALARRITSRAALLRQRQFVAKLMRSIDCDPVRRALDAEAQKARTEAAGFRRAERWRERLIADGAAAYSEFTGEFPPADPARLAQLVAAAIAERRGGRSTAAARELFRGIRALMDTRGPLR